MPDTNNPHRTEKMERALKDLQDAMLVVSEIERRQSELLREHSERIVWIERINAEAAEFRRRTEQNLAEISDKLNGLIGYVDHLQRPPGGAPAS
jgi:hypothetical protein